MGKGFIQFYKQKLKKEWKFAFFSTFVVAVLVHLYKLTNTLPNHDSVYNYYSEQNMIDSGRWTLAMVSGVSSYFDLPWLNGLLCCFYIALTVVVIVALLRIKNPVVIGLTGALLAVSPAVTETLFFNFTADAYFFAMLLAAVAVFLTRIEYKRWYYTVLSGVFICISCGIYQAYVSFGLVLAVCYFIDVLLQGTYERKEYRQWVLRQVIVFASSVIVYYVIWKISLKINGTTPNDYQGIADADKFDFSVFLGGFLRAMKSAMFYFTQWNLFEHGVTLYSILSILFLVALAAVLVLASITSRLYKKRWAMGWLVLACLSVVPFSCIWHFTSPSVGYRPMMLTSLVMLFVLGAVLYERWTKPVLKNAMCLLLILIVFNNCVMANISYYYMNKCQEQTYAEGIEMMVRIHDLQEEHQIEKIAIVGSRHVDVMLDFFDEKTGKIAPAGKVYMLSTLLETNLFMDHEHTILYLQENFKMNIPSVKYHELPGLAQQAQVKEMECWPAVGSMAVIDGILIVKLADT